MLMTDEEQKAELARVKGEVCRLRNEVDDLSAKARILWLNTSAQSEIESESEELWQKLEEIAGELANLEDDEEEQEEEEQEHG